MNVVKNITIKLISFLLIGVVFLLIANHANNMHLHRMADGTIVSHSHPYNKACDSNPLKTHQHTKFELFFFEMLDILFPLALILALLFQSKPVLKKYHFRIGHIIQLTFQHKFGRASPIIV